MDGHGHVEPVSDAALEREIESLLAVEPSPEFIPRVRSRVADETPRASWAGWPLRVVMASVALAVIVAAALWPSNDGGSPEDTQARSPVVERVPLPPPSVEPARRVAAVVEPEPARRTPPAPRTAAAAADRLVPVVNEEDGKAFDTLLATIRSHRVVLTFSEPPDASPPAAAPLVIAPIVIDPLPDVLEGGVE